MTDGAPLIHIGYHKTATTWLQRHAFRAAELGFALIEPRRMLNEQVAAPHDVDFDPDRCRSAFDLRLKRATRAGLVPVLSTERLCGDVLYGAYDSVLIAERLARTWPDARVAIVIREQREMIVASYQQYVRTGGQLRFDQYARRPPARGRYLLPYVIPHFEYDRLIAHYHRLFGRERVLVLPFELFRNRPVEFLTQLTRSAGIEPVRGAVERLAFDEMVNPSWSLPAVAARRSANVLLRGRMNPWAPIDVRGPLGRKLSRAIVAGAQAVPAVVEKRLRERMLQSLEGAARDRYEASNARTAALTGIDLAGFGYPVAPWAGNDRSLAAWSG